MTRPKEITKTYNNNNFWYSVREGDGDEGCNVCVCVYILYLILLYRVNRIWVFLYTHIHTHTVIFRLIPTTKATGELLPRLRDLSIFNRARHENRRRARRVLYKRDCAVAVPGEKEIRADGRRDREKTVSRSERIHYIIIFYIRLWFMAVIHNAERARRPPPWTNGWPRASPSSPRSSSGRHRLTPRIPHVFRVLVCTVVFLLLVASGRHRRVFFSPSLLGFHHTYNRSALQWRPVFFVGNAFSSPIWKREHFPSSRTYFLPLPLPRNIEIFVSVKVVLILNRSRLGGNYCFYF